MGFFIRSSGWGHILVEIYDRQRARWIMLDVFNNVLALDAKTGEPLGAMQFRVKFLTDHDSIRFVPIGPGRPQFIHYHKLVEYYDDGINQWYLWNGNNVVGRSDHWLVRVAGHVGEPIAELASIALGHSPHIVPVSSAQNDVDIVRLKRIRAWLIAALVVASLLLCTILGLTAAMVTQRIRRRYTNKINGSCAISSSP